MNAGAHARQPGRTADEGLQDTSGWGLLGLSIGVLAGFAIAFFFILPLLPKDRGTLMVTLLTAIVTATMTIGGALGYTTTRRKHTAPTRRT